MKTQPNVPIRIGIAEEEPGIECASETGDYVSDDAGENLIDRGGPGVQLRVEPLRSGREATHSGRASRTDRSGRRRGAPSHHGYHQLVDEAALGAARAQCVRRRGELDELRNRAM